jgi:hypothetical protein
VVTPVENNESETVSKEIFVNGFVDLVYQCKFTLTVGRSLSTNYQRNSLHYLIFNIQKQLWPILSAVEVFNKTVKKYLASFINNSTLDWENLLPALMLAHNTIYHSTIANTPFELLFSIKP